MAEKDNGKTKLAASSLTAVISYVFTLNTPNCTILIDISK